MEIIGEQLLPRRISLGFAFGSQIDIGPSGKPVFHVPQAFAVTQ